MAVANMHERAGARFFASVCGVVLLLLFIAGIAFAVDEDPSAALITNPLIVTAATEQRDPAAGERKSAQAEASQLSADVLDGPTGEVGPHDVPTATDFSNTLLIGDSIMVLTSKAIKEELPGVAINACSGRSLEKGGITENYAPDKGVLDIISADEGSYRRYVIGTGNNDPAGMDEEDAEFIVSALGDNVEIWFVTELVLGNATGTEHTNATIEDVAARHSNVYIVDWNEIADRSMLLDHVHPNSTGIKAYVACLKDALVAQAA